MHIEYDPDKDAINRDKHGISLADAVHFNWGTAFFWADDRFDYGEVRMCALGYVRSRLHFVVFVNRGQVRRIISLRRANPREEKRYASAETRHDLAYR